MTTIRISQVIHSFFYLLSLYSLFFINNFTLGYDLSQSIICYPLCKSCFGTAQNQCQLCLDGNPPVNNTCLCPIGEYDDGLGNCKPCDASCYTCQSQTKCIICAINRTIDANSKCNCNAGFYEDTNKNCIKCGTDCTTCDQNGCLTCIDSFKSPDASGICQCTDVNMKIDTSSGKCICKDNYYWNTVLSMCTSCGSNCLKCASNGSCITCDSTLNFISQNGQCICQIGFYLDNNGICSKCYFKCKSCKSFYQCTSCDSVLQFRQLDTSTQTCVCKLNYVEDLSQNICVPQIIGNCADTNCQICSNINVCTQCLPSYYLYQSICVQTCPKGYSPNLNNACTIIQKIKYTLIEYSENTFRILFDTDLSNPDNFIQNIQISIPSFENKYTVKVERISNKELTVLILPKSVPSNKNYNIIFKFDENTQTNLSNYNEQIDAKLHYQASESTKQTTQAITGTTQVASQATIASLLPLAISGNFQFIASAVDISQLIYLMNFINIDFPYNLDSFYDSLKDFKIPFKNFFEMVEDYQDITYRAPSKFENKDIQGFYLENFGDSISLLVTILMCNFIIYLLEIGLRIKSTWQQKVNKLRNKVFTIKFYFELLWVIYLDMTVSLILQVQVFEFNNQVSEIINYILMFCGLLISLVPLVSIYFLFKNKFKHSLEAFTENMNYKYYFPIQYIRKYYYSIFICGFSFSPLTQVVSLMIWNAFMFALVLKTQPNRLKAYNIRDVISNLLFFTSTTLLLLFLLPQFEDEDNQMLLGWIVTANLGCMIIIELGFFVKETIYSIIEIIKKTKEKLSYQKKYPSNKVAPLSPVSTLQNIQNDQDILQEDQDIVKSNDQKPSIYVRPFFKKPEKLNKILKRKNSNSTHDIVDKQDNSFYSSPTKSQRPCLLPSNSNLKGSTSTLNYLPNISKNATSSHLQPPPSLLLAPAEMQSLDLGSQNLQESSQKLDIQSKSTFKDMQASDRKLIYSPTTQTKQILIGSSPQIDKSHNINGNSELNSFIQNSEILKQFIQNECTTDRKRSENQKFEFSLANKKGHKRIQSVHQISQNLLNIEKSGIN